MRFRVPRTRQPHTNGQLNISHPLLRGLVWAFDYAGNWLGGSFARPTITKRSAYGVSASPAGLRLAPVANNGFTFTGPSTALDEFTIILIGDSTALSVPIPADQLIGVTGLGASDTGISPSGYGSGGDLYWNVYYSPNYSGSSQISATGVVKVGPVVLAQSYKRNTWHRGYVNGVQVASGTPGDFPANFNAIGSTFGIGCPNAQSTGIQAALFFSRALTDEEAKELTLRPWQVFNPIVRMLSVPGATSPDVAVSLTGSAATFSAGALKSSISQSLSGSAATFSAGTAVPVVSQTLSGQAGAFSAGTLTSAISYSLSGQAATFSAGTLTQAVSYSLAGQAATFAAGTLVPEVSYTLGGQVATFATGTITTTGGDAGDVSRTLSGEAVTLATGTLTGAIAYTLGGQSGTFAVGTLVPAVSTSLTGIAATFSAGTLTEQVTGNVERTLTGIDLGFLQGTLTPTGADEQARAAHAGGGWQRTRNYIVKGKRYYNLTELQLSVLLAEEYGAEVKRSEVKVAIRGKKPHQVSAQVWHDIRAALETQHSRVDDDEAAAMLLL